MRSIEVKLTRSAVVGKPFTVSEVNEPFPSDYQAEMIPLLASYGAFQDWDGIFIYASNPSSAVQWKPEIGDHFDISQDPVKIAQMPVGAMLFLRHDVAAARQTIERTYSTAQVDESMRLPTSRCLIGRPAFLSRCRLNTARASAASTARPPPKFTDAPANPIVSDTHQLSWLLSNKTGNGVVTVDTDRSNALVGFVKENNAQTSHLTADVANAFCSITLSALDDQPLSRSGSMLLTATGRSENTGMAWDERRANVTDWGAAPTRIEVIKGWLLLKNIEYALQVAGHAARWRGPPAEQLFKAACLPKVGGRSRSARCPQQAM